MAIKFDTDEIKNSLGNYDFPRVVVIETTSYCNLKCTLCPQSTMIRKKGAMSLDIFKKIADEISIYGNDTSMWLALMGEPLMQADRLIDMITYAKSKSVKQVNLNTNGMLLTPMISQRLIESKLDKIILSMDGFKAKTYESIRVGGVYKNLLSNVCNLISINKSYGNPLEIVAQFIVTEENEKELGDFKNFWLGKGLTVKIRPKLSWGHAIEAKNHKLTQKDRVYPCPWLMRTVIVHWNGDFAQCDADFEAHYIVGNVATKSIKDVWDRELKERRDKHWVGDFSHPLCHECNDWQVGRSLFFRRKDAN